MHINSIGEFINIYIKPLIGIRGGYEDHKQLKRIEEMLQDERLTWPVEDITEIFYFMHKWHRNGLNVSNGVENITRLGSKNSRGKTEYFYRTVVRMAKSVNKDLDKIYSLIENLKITLPRSVYSYDLEDDWKNIPMKDELQNLEEKAYKINDAINDVNNSRLSSSSKSFDDKYDFLGHQGKHFLQILVTMPLEYIYDMKQLGRILEESVNPDD